MEMRIKNNTIDLTEYKIKLFKNLKMGDVIIVNLKGAENIGKHIQSKIRPAIIVSNNANNLHCPNIQIVIMSTSITKTKLPTHINVSTEELSCLKNNSTILGETIMQIGKEHVIKKVGQCSFELMRKVKDSIKIQLALKEDKKEVEPIDWEYVADLVRGIKTINKIIREGIVNDTLMTLKRSSIKGLKRLSKIYNISVKEFMDIYDENGKRIMQENSKII